MCIKLAYPQKNVKDTTFSFLPFYLLIIFYCKGHINIVPPIVTYNALIHGLCKKGKLAKARKLFYRIPNKKIDLDVVTYIAFLDGHINKWEHKQPIKVLHEMLDKWINLNIITYNVLIAGYCKANKLIAGYCKENKLHKTLGLLHITGAYSQS